MIVFWHPTKQRPMKCIVCHEHVNIFRTLLIIIIIYSTLEGFTITTCQMLTAPFFLVSSFLCLHSHDKLLRVRERHVNHKSRLAVSYNSCKRNRCSVSLHHSSIHSFFIASIVGAVDASWTNLIYVAFSFKLIDFMSANSEGMSSATDEQDKMHYYAKFNGFPIDFIKLDHETIINENSKFMNGIENIDACICERFM